MSYINIRNIEKNYPSFRLMIEELTIERGEFFGLIGPSGCGKTTLLRILAGLEEKYRGEVHVNGRDITALPSEKRNIGMIFQQPLLFPHMTIGENIEFGLKMKKVPKAEGIKRIREALQWVALPDFQHRYPVQLSGGQQQRVAIARALVLEPEILLMDEPFSALDPSLREEMGELIKKIHQSYKMTIVFVTHDQREAFALFDTMAVMKEGRILQVNSPHKAYQQPDHSFVAEFLGCKNILQGKMDSGKFQYKNLELQLPQGQFGKSQAFLVLRPECLRIENRSSRESLENRIYLRGNIQDYHFQQGFQWITVRVGEVLFQVMEQTSPYHHYHVGQGVELSYDPRDIWMIREKGER